MHAFWERLSVSKTVLPRLVHELTAAAARSFFFFFSLIIRHAEKKILSTCDTRLVRTNAVLKNCMRIQLIRGASWQSSRAMVL